jgi:hypothetical protein
MLKEITELEQKVREYFADFFEEISFHTGTVNGHNAYGISGLRNGKRFDYSDNNTYWEGPDNMLYHFLENIKGDIIRQEQTIILEK